MTDISQLNFAIQSIKTSTIGSVLEVVVEIGYKITLEIGGRFATVEGFASLDPFNMDPEDFLEFNQITQADSIQWVKDSIGPERLRQIADQLTDQIENQQENQILPVERSLPWN
jgi:hypothetical protein